MSAETKCCSKCGEKLPRTREYFFRRADAVDGLRGICKVCYRAYQKEFRNLPASLERRSAYYRQYYTENKDWVQERHGRYRVENKDRGREYAKQYRAEHKEEMLEYQRQYGAEYPEKRKAVKQRYRAKKAHSGGSFTPKEWLSLCEQYGNRCLWCGESKPLAADHIVPVSKGGSSDIENIQPLCGSCNSRKGAQPIDFRIAYDILHGCDELVARAWAA